MPDLIPTDSVLVPRKDPSTSVEGNSFEDCSPADLICQLASASHRPL
jgi:hypothetical protein